jgi:Raf kinase inhibitor-like YbhB/YbcL family protein
MKFHIWPLLILAAFALVLGSCAQAEEPDAPPQTPAGAKPSAEESGSAAQTEPTFQLTSPAFEDGGTIPVRHACHGEDRSPPLAWTEPPTGTQSFALLMDDPDAVDVVGFVWDHWVLYNLPPETRSLPEGLPPNPELPDGSRQGETSFRRIGYGGPCPPSGQTHAYGFRLYALDTHLALEPGATKDQVLEAMQGYVLDQAELIGRYTSP